MAMAPSPMRETSSPRSEMCLMAVGSLGSARDDAQLLLPGERLLAQRLIPHVEAALEAIRPLLADVMRGVARARRVIQEERLLRGQRLGVLDELERLVGEIHRQVIALLRRARRLNRMAVVH